MTHCRNPKLRRMGAFLMALVMTAAIFPAAVFAAEETEEEPAAESPQPPLVNIIETEPAAEDEEPAQEPSESGEEPEEPAGPEEQGKPEAPEEQLPAGEDEPVPDDRDASDDPESASEEDLFDSGEDGAPDGSFTVSYYDGETLLLQETVADGALPAQAPAATSSGARICGWKDAAGNAVDAAKTPVTADVSYYAWLAPQMETTHHIRYINGLGDSKFGPEASLTRGQAAMIIYNLLTTTEMGPNKVTFSDVSSGAYYYNAVMTLASYGILTGYENGTFLPNRSVTRAEFVTILVRMTGAAGSGSSFTDVSSHWAKASIEAASANGWINGYQQSDGTYQFRPQNAIKRCEAVTIVNRVTGRSADEAALHASSDPTIYVDVAATAWYYAAVMEASVPHEYSRTESGETWQNYTFDDVVLTPGIYSTDGKWYIVRSDGHIASMKAGVNEVEGKYYFAPAAGTYFTGDFNRRSGYIVFSDGKESELSNGFNLIDGKLFYWEKSTGTPKKLSAGLNKIGNTTYWADEAGYMIRNDFGKGVATLGGKKYLSSGYCDIITTGLGFKNSTSKPTTIDLKQQTYEYEGNMYYLKSDYSLACDEWVGYLYFGTNCAYTSGNAKLDAYVWNVVKNIVSNTAITREQRLLKAYYYIRGGEGNQYSSSPFRYSKAVDHGFKRGRYNGQQNYSWITSCALTMFSEKKGMCYEWASIYLFLARRLGFQSYIVVGSVFQKNTRHCWCMIQWDNKWHVSDVEIEWGYIAGWYTGGQSIYFNLFDQTVSNEKFSTYTSPISGVSYWVWEES